MSLTDDITSGMRHTNSNDATVANDNSLYDKAERKGMAENDVIYLRVAEDPMTQPYQQRIDSRALPTCFQRLPRTDSQPPPSDRTQHSPPLRG